MHKHICYTEHTRMHPAYGFNPQNTAQHLTYKSRNLTSLVCIDICYLQISNMCKEGPIFIYSTNHSLNVKQDA